ncbi:PREDICTED: uncharacterized protein LOC104793612 [Camelina sativa]|uniref:Uncharacterized protein LOC104793612 n=1 Tax=Camelina sativa TaxID=90675 RepID=A0ABM0ZNN3_CAMSA|nr:PREDICTED: uncharacterized protein LOC104793612 [Camelina sativa]
MQVTHNRDHKIWDCGSPLYDSYELASFAHIIERRQQMPLSPLARQCKSGVTLRALMNKDNEECSSASTTTTRVRDINRRKRWWNGKKNDEKKERINKKKMFACFFFAI